MPPDLRAIRPWNGSQHEAFEELCCQIASFEPVPTGALFRRKRGAGGDAGVECYWRLPDGCERCWQAKYFFTLGDSQWEQLDESVETALEKHPRLALYTVCLPTNLTDARVARQRSTQDRWDIHVAKWQGWAAAKGMAVEFSLWGEFDLTERLSRSDPAYAGRAHFWFNEQELDADWFARRFDEARANVGPRYTPELHIDLPEARLLEGLARSDGFFARLEGLYGELARHLARAIRWETQVAAVPGAAPHLARLSERAAALTAALRDIGRDSARPIDFGRVAALASDVDETERRCHEALRPAESADDGRAVAPADNRREREVRESLRHDALQICQAARELHEFATDDAALAANRGALLLLGSAGTGKTHLLCDAAAARLAAGLPTVLLLGQQFADAEPWGQIIAQLGLSCQGRDLFLGALDAAAQARGGRALILIDALNEGAGKFLWRKHLAGLLRALERYPRIAIALTCRSGYEPIVIPDNLLTDRLVSTTHRGFANHEYTATRTFFDHYGIERPAMPLLVPEFSNPLFLKLFCEGLHRRGLTRVPAGLAGITAVFDLFIDAINRALARPERLDYAERAGPVRRAGAALATRMAESGRPWVRWEEGEALVNAVLPRPGGWSGSLFAALLGEGLLTEDLGYLPATDGEGPGDYITAVRFPYEKFSDHLVVRHLLDAHLDVAEPVRAFAPDAPLGQLLASQRDAGCNSGWIEAMSIQLPERIGRELVDLVPRARPWYAARRGFLESLIWREPERITDVTLEYLDQIFRSRDGAEAVYNVVLTLAGTPGHRLNAASLHRHLSEQAMPERDQVWSTYLHYQHGEHGPVDRLLEWAWEAETAQLSDESADLCAIALAWFLTTPNRFVRDRATKALVRLLAPKPLVMIRVLERFATVGDPYVRERLYAAAYGVAMIGADNDAVARLASAVYDEVFAGGSPPTHLLLRDYARGVIEVARERGVLSPSIDLDLVRPPYRSAWPLAIPSEEEHAALQAQQESATDQFRVGLHIRSSIAEFGDFGTYVIKPRVGHWSNWPLGATHEPTGRQLSRRFVEALTPRQRRAWDRFQAVVASFTISNFRFDESEPHRTDDEWQALLTRSESAFLGTLGRVKRRLYDEVIVPAQANPIEDRPHLDPALAQRWIFRRVFELGWTAERFGQFDDIVERVHNKGRSPDKPERMGKKYQWIALHEFLAHLADNLEFFGERWSDEPQSYDGPWQINARDIDPSLMLRRLPGDGDSSPTAWWQPTAVHFDEVDQPEKIAWLRRTDDLPDPRAMLQSAHPDDGTTWCLLQNDVYRWLEAAPVDVDPYTHPRRHLALLVRGYLASSEGADELVDWLARQDFFGRWMPEEGEGYQAFLGEYPWASAWREQADANEWRRDGQERLPRPVIVPTTRYSWHGSSFDCSIDDSIAVALPSPWLVRALGLRWSGRAFCFVGSAGEPLVVAPSAEEEGPEATLIARSRLQRFLVENELVMLWTILGERELWGGRDREWHGRLTFSGVYRLRDDACEGGLKSTFQEPRESDDEPERGRT